MENRRNFIGKLIAFFAFFGLSSTGIKAGKVALTESEGIVHHVFFWLKNPTDTNARRDFEKGLGDLVKIPEILKSQIGLPVESPREVVDDSFTYSYLVFFKNKVDLDIYGIHPVHLKFIADCQHLWSKVLVYDAMEKAL
jgi:hypothetical protein